MKKNPREPYMLPEEQCERMRRTELCALKMLLAHLSSAAFAQEDLKDRLDCIPNGNQRMRMAVGGLRAVCDDLIGTITVAQAKQIRGTMNDFEIRLIPKLSPNSQNVIMTVDVAKTLLDYARLKCRECTANDNESRNCTLYQFMEATTPLEHYGDGLICPYALQEWE
jgi:hypothetical protein